MSRKLSTCNECLAPERDCVCEWYSCGCCGLQFLQSEGTIYTDKHTQEYAEFVCDNCQDIDNHSHATVTIDELSKEASNYRTCDTVNCGEYAPLLIDGQPLCNAHAIVKTERKGDLDSVNRLIARVREVQGF